MSPTAVYKEEDTYNILLTLCDRGWIPLVKMTTLLGYSSSTVIYQRQRSKSPIPTVRVGGINRVDEDTVIQTLESSRNTSHAKVILDVYRRIKRNG